MHYLTRALKNSTVLLAHKLIDLVFTLLAAAIVAAVSFTAVDAVSEHDLLTDLVELAVRADDLLADINDELHVIADELATPTPAP